jgi:hypothetical protein
MIKVPISHLSRLVAGCVIEADERAICEGCWKSAYVHVKEVGALDALAAITHAPDCFVEIYLRVLAESKDEPEYDEKCE